MIAAFVALAAAGCVGILTRNSPEYLAEQPGATHPADQMFQAATDLFYARHFDDARRAFLKLLEQYPRTRHTPAAQFKIAECLFFLDDFRNAAVYFQRYMDAYPQGPDYYDARARLAQCKEKGVTDTPALLAGNRPSDRLIAVMIPVLAGRNLVEVSVEMDRLARMGVNTVILRAFHNAGQPFHGLVTSPTTTAGVYFRTSHAPVVYDLLDDVAKICHRNGLRIFAWMNTREAVWGLPDRPELRTWRYDFAKGDIVPGEGLNLFHPQTEARLVGLFRDLATNDIDGVILQDDLLLRYDEDFSFEARQAYHRLTRHDLLPVRLYRKDAHRQAEAGGLGGFTEEYWEFARMKRDRLVEIQARLGEVVKEIRPTARFGVSFLYTAVNNPAQGLAFFAQDLTKSGEEGFDYYAVTAYQTQIARDLSLTEDQVYDVMENVAGRARAIIGSPEQVVIKLQVVDWERGRLLALSQIEKALARVAAGGVPGIALFPYRPDFPFDAIRAALARFESEATGSPPTEGTNGKER